jgi:hypothetical protein
MRDHLHMLIGVPGDGQLANLIRDFKRITTRIGGIDWQRNCFDHRLRHDESENEKVAYIRANPVRGGLVGPNDHWLPAYVAAYRLLHSRLRCPLLGMKTNELSRAALASLRRGRLGFPAENARAAGKRRHILRSNAFADR